MRLAVTLVVCLLLPVGGARAQAADKPQDTLTLYRCSSANGVVSLQDAPCAKSQTQQIRTVPRLRDPPPQPAAPPTAPAPTVTVPATTRTVYLTPPRPLYECVTPDGQRYLSEDGRGNPRWQPQWALGYPLLTPRPQPRPLPYPPVQPLQAGISASVSSHSGTLTVSGTLGSTSPTLGGIHHAPPVLAGGVWVQDDCARLPPAEACARLRDRRAELRTRFFNAQEKERDVLRREERTLNAQLDNDCGGR